MRFFKAWKKIGHCPPRNKPCRSPSTLTEPSSTKQVIVVRKDLPLGPAKLATQVAHASIGFLLDKMLREDDGTDIYQLTLQKEESDWLRFSRAKIVVGIDNEQDLRQLIDMAQEAGLTVHQVVNEDPAILGGIPTLTCAALGPNEATQIDDLTWHLPLLASE